MPMQRDSAVMYRGSEEKSAYEAGQLAGMNIDTVPGALEKLSVTFTGKTVRIIPALTRVRDVDLFRRDGGALDKSEQESFIKGIKDWLKSTRTAKTKEIWHR